jgi:hypothetical protein
MSGVQTSMSTIMVARVTTSITDAAIAMATKTRMKITHMIAGTRTIIATLTSTGMAILTVMSIRPAFTIPRKRRSSTAVRLCRASAVR